MLENLKKIDEKKIVSPTPNDALVAMYVRIDPAVKERCEQAAKKHRRSLASYVELVLRAGLIHDEQI